MKIIINIFYLKKELDVTFSFFIRNTLIYISTAFVVAVLVEFTFPGRLFSILPTATNSEVPLLYRIFISIVNIWGPWKGGSKYFTGLGLILQKAIRD